MYARACEGSIMLCGAEEACRTHNPKAEGSKPSKAKLVLAQLVERSTVVGNKHRTAAGSIPASQKYTSSGSVTVA